MAVITLKPKDVIIPFNLVLRLGKVGTEEEFDLDPELSKSETPIPVENEKEEK